MRINQIELIRYGKFTDRSVGFPRAMRDFHLVVGPNEAGKSTIHQAILDLLYGIPKNTSYGFLHPMPDLRLGASIEHDATTLTFHRTKGNRQTLRTPSDDALPDGILGTYLGTTDRAFFEQMFGLNYEKLVAGGGSILSASNDVGQILFQSAAGVASLGKVRDALEQEADTLWSRRKGGDRAYHSAAAELETATARLKALTLRSKVWSEAHAEVAQLASEFKAERARHAALGQRKQKLERVRRLAPHFASLQRAQVALKELAGVPTLPISAETTVTEAKEALALSDAEYRTQSAAATRAKEQLEAIELDEAILLLSDEVTTLDEQRLRLRDHEADIARRQAEVDARWKLACEAAAKLQWSPSSEEILLKRLPSLLVRKTLERHIREYGASQKAVEAAKTACSEKAAEIERASRKLEQLPGGETPHALQAALAKAHGLGESFSVRAERYAEVMRRTRELADAVAPMRKWGFDIEALAEMTLPDQSLVRSFEQDDQAEEAEARRAKARIAQLTHQVKERALMVKQYEESHRAVTREEVIRARASRNSQWEALRDGHLDFAAGAGEYEQLTRVADALADERHDTIKDASELLAQKHQLERLEQELAEAERELGQLAKSSEQRLARWNLLLENHRLPEISWSGFGEWADARRGALSAASGLLEAEADLQGYDDAIEIARTSLGTAITELKQTILPNASLPELALRAAELIKSRDDARGQRRTLVTQIEDAKAALERLEAKEADAEGAMQNWQSSWRDALKEAGLPENSGPEEVEAALPLIEQVETALAEMQRIRAERIDTMRADLAHFAESVRGIAASLEIALHDREPISEFVIQLTRRLALAKETKTLAQRLHEDMKQAQSALESAKGRMQSEEARLQPLMERAGAKSTQELDLAIARSEARRKADTSAAEAERALLDGGDGLSIEKLQEELESVDAPQLVQELTELASELEESLGRLNTLSARKERASAQLERFVGSDAAAEAESTRQEALASMGHSARRFIKVYASARLLRWAIERYRREKQGPMLALASKVFSGLTLHSFARLAVDFDSRPPRLLGQRVDGSMVEVEGMSEGTRDQLFLALRLAALDMHLEQAHVLPFLADDLFINYDDARARAGFAALGNLSEKTQVIFFTHHSHLVPVVRDALGADVNVVEL